MFILSFQFWERSENFTSGREGWLDSKFDSREFSEAWGLDAGANPRVGIWALVLSRRSHWRGKADLLDVGRYAALKGTTKSPILDFRVNHCSETGCSAEDAYFLPELMSEQIEKRLKSKFDARWKSSTEKFDSNIKTLQFKLAEVDNLNAALLKKLTWRGVDLHPFVFSFLNLFKAWLLIYLTHTPVWKHFLEHMEWLTCKKFHFFKALKFFTWHGLFQGRLEYDVSPLQRFAR